MKQLIKMSKEELRKLTAEQKKQKAIQDIKQILSKDKRLTGATIEIKIEAKIVSIQE